MDPNNTPSRAKARSQAGQKYIPFNHDPANVGTRTGQPMPSNVRRDSMGFENISEFFESPDGITTRTDALTTRTTATGASGMTSVRRSYTSRRTEVDEGGSGEMTMDIETPTHRSRPNGNLAATPSGRLARAGGAASDDEADDNYNFDRPPPLNLPSASKRQMSRRPAAQDEEDDEEEDEDADSDSREALRRGVSSSRRKSAQPGALSDDANHVFGADASFASAGGVGGAGNDDFQVDDGGFDDDGDDYGGGGADDDDDGYQDDAQQDALDVDQAIGLAADEEEEEQMPRTTASNKGKGKAAAAGKKGRNGVLQDKTNKRRVAATTDGESDAERPAQKRARAARAMSVEQMAIRRPADEENTDSYLRTKRERRKPLEYWRGERPVLTRKVEADGNLAPTYVVAEWLEVPKEEPEPLAARRVKTGKGRGRSASVKPNLGRITEEGEDYSHWDDGTEASGVVLDSISKTDVLRKIAVTSKMVRLATVFNATFQYEKIFGEQDFFAAGVFKIDVGGEKTAKDSRDNCYVFYVINGAVDVTIHRTKFVMAQGGQFFVPRSNIYSIKNIAKEEARLFFSQARRLRQEVYEGTENSAMPTETTDENAKSAPRKKGRPAASKSR